MIKLFIPLTFCLSTLAVISQARAGTELDKLFAVCTTPDMTLDQRAAAAQGLFDMESHHGDRDDFQIALWEEGITLAAFDDPNGEKDWKSYYRDVVTSARKNPNNGFILVGFDAYLENPSGSHALTILENKKMSIYVCLFITRFPADPVKGSHEIKSTKAGPAGSAVFYKIPKPHKIKALIAETIYPSAIFTKWVPDRPPTNSITRITTRFAK
jgi:hypothetical protein